MKKLLLLALILGGTVTLPAQIVFTIHATANSTALGYTAGQPLTFNVTLNAAPIASQAAQPGNYVSWGEELVSQTQIFTNVAGTGVSGSWVRPTAVDGSPWSAIQVNSSGGLYIGVGSDFGSNGITVGGSTPTFWFYAVYPTLPVGFLSAQNLVTEANAVFAGLVGTYTSSSTVFGQISAGSSVGLTVNDIVISGGAAAVPEPATWGAALGAFALGLAAWRRRVRK